MGLFAFFRKRGGQLQYQQTPLQEPRLARIQQRQRMGPERPLIYTFEHHTLRREVFENHPEFMADMTGNLNSSPLFQANGLNLTSLPGVPKKFWHAIANAEILCEQNNYAGQVQVDESPHCINTYDAERKLLSSISIHALKRTGYTVYILAMPEPKFSPEAYFIAVVHRDDECHAYMTISPSTRYFTLEKTRGSPQPLLCEWNPRGTHRNFGTFLAPDIALFAEWVFARVVQETNGL